MRPFKQSAFVLGYQVEGTYNLVMAARFAGLEHLQFAATLMDPDGPGDPAEALSVLWDVTRDVAKLSNSDYLSLCSRLKLPANPREATEIDYAVFACCSAFNGPWRKLQALAEQLDLPTEFQSELGALRNESMQIMSAEIRAQGAVAFGLEAPAEDRCSYTVDRSQHKLVELLGHRHGLEMASTYLCGAIMSRVEGALASAESLHELRDLGPKHGAIVKLQDAAISSLETLPHHLSTYLETDEHEAAIGVKKLLAGAKNDWTRRRVTSLIRDVRRCVEFLIQCGSPPAKETIEELTEAWITSDATSERGCQDSLVSLLKAHPSCTEVLTEKQVGRLRVDIQVKLRLRGPLPFAFSVYIELKYKIRQHNQLQRLLGQVEQYIDNGLLPCCVVVCGDSDVDLVRRLRRAIARRNEELSGPCRGHQLFLLTR